MANTKQDDQMNGSQNSMESPSGRDFESQGQGPDTHGQSQQTGHAGGYGRDTGDQGKNPDDDDMITAGGREGSFSESERDKEGQWSPGSTQSSDQ